MTVRDTSAMIAGMDPVLQPGDWMFCTLAPDDARAQTLAAAAWSLTREDEGLSLILPAEQAQAAGLSGEGPMAHIQLNVFSSLDGIGLTAAVSTILANADISCNIVAAYHHDHVFVPVARATDALDLLRARAAQEAR